MTRARRVGAVAACAAAASCAGVAPASQSGAPAAAVSLGPALTALVEQTARDAHVRAFGPCDGAPTASVTAGDRFPIVDPLLADLYPDGADAPRVTLAVSGCGTQSAQNVFLYPDERVVGGFATWLALPGGSQASPALQVEALDALAGVALSTGAGCEDDETATLFVLDTALTSPPPDGEAAWEELWRVSACGVEAGYQMRFEPGADGLQILFRPV